MQLGGCGLSGARPARDACLGQQQPDCCTVLSGSPCVTAVSCSYNPPTPWLLSRTHQFPVQFVKSFRRRLQPNVVAAGSLFCRQWRQRHRLFLLHARKIQQLFFPNAVKTKMSWRQIQAHERLRTNASGNHRSCYCWFSVVFMLGSVSLCRLVTASV